MDNNVFDGLEIEALSDDALEMVAGGKSSDGPSCCSCRTCSDNSGNDGGTGSGNTIGK